MFKKILNYSYNFFLCFNNAFSIEPDIFVQSTVNRASAILGDDISKEKKLKN